MKRLSFSILLAGLSLCFLTAPSIAALTPIGMGEISGVGNYKLVYDSAQDITWLDYSSAADTWSGQKDWAENLVISFEGMDYSLWRLFWGPTGVDTFSEMYFMKQEIDASGINPFNELQTNFYWSFHEYWEDPGGDYAFVFANTVLQADLLQNKELEYLALAVHPGNLASVPLPGAVWLLGVGIIGLSGINRKLRRQAAP